MPYHPVGNMGPVVSVSAYRKDFQRGTKNNNCCALIVLIDILNDISNKRKASLSANFQGPPCKAKGGGLRAN